MSQRSASLCTRCIRANAFPVDGMKNCKFLIFVVIFLCFCIWFLFQNSTLGKTILLLTLFEYPNFWSTIFLTLPYSWHQTIKPQILVFQIFFYKTFPAWAVEKENKLFTDPKPILSSFWTNEKFVFFFIWTNCEKFPEKIGENKIRGLVVWCHEKATHIFWILNVKFKSLVNFTIHLGQIVPS